MAEARLSQLLARGTKRRQREGARAQSIVERHNDAMAQGLTGKWLAVRRRATQLQRQYSAQMISYCRGKGPPPDDDMKKQLRSVCEHAARSAD
jgi:hypothetical protein